MTDEKGNPNAPDRPDPARRDDGPSGETATDPGDGSDPVDDGSDRDGSGPTDRSGVADGEETARIPPGVADSRRRSDGRPRPQPGSRAADRDAGLLTRFRTAQSGPLLFIRETLYSALAVAAVGFLLFAISGVWPPMVAVESGSMEPEMSRGDLIFVTEPHRFTPEYAYGDTGVVTVDIGSEEGYRSFGGNGSVVIYDPPDRAGSPIIHRAHFYVEEGENWYDRANPDYMNANDCSQLSNCPAPHDGFITKGDANARYDQASNIAGPVRSEWIRGTARIRIPYLGYVRLKLAGAIAA
ncbi:S24/S26 family peptidase [Halobellus limi]|jgi:signal peptidase|uniref:Signal peptidase, endoplasmic reticulum-type n=1 Tax=Halobellus limi TaxID=699433 RepID=A0A1H5X1C7_9EURY|nr:signal peptidase, endoplasmic reticulum-type [Halobellus limi]